jgi:D-inositol-3-phosphate glycosyltransferase
MFSTQFGRIALISVDGDPAAEIGQEEAGGQNVYVRQIGQTLARQGWQVDMFTRRTSPMQSEIMQHSNNCRTIRLTAGPQAFMSRDCLFTHLPEFVQAFLAFQKQQGIQYPLVHTHYWLSSWVGMELKRYQPLVQVHTYHSLGAVKYQAVPESEVAATRLAVEKHCLETVDCVIATSPQEEEHLRTFVSPKGQIYMIPCGTDPERFGQVSRLKARYQLGIAVDDPVVLYVGRFDPRKGIETLVRAVAYSQFRRHNLKVIIAGGSRPGQSDGIERERIANLVADLGLEDCIEFPGRLDETLPLYYAAADVCVVPSHYEPFGLVAIEAMASHTPVIASQVGGLQFTVIPNTTGLLVSPKDDLGFAMAIDQVLGNPDWRDQMGGAGRVFIEIAFSWDSVAARLGQLYNTLLSHPTSAYDKPTLVAA